MQARTSSFFRDREMDFANSRGSPYAQGQVSVRGREMRRKHLETVKEDMQAVVGRTQIRQM